MVRKNNSSYQSLVASFRCFHESADADDASTDIVIKADGDCADTRGGADNASVVTTSLHDHA